MFSYIIKVRRWDVCSIVPPETIQRQHDHVIGLGFGADIDNQEDDQDQPCDSYDVFEPFHFSSILFETI
jgi:hypothetical protein